MSILCASHLKKYYGKDESLVKALDDVNVSVENGQFVAIVGTSGSGKSTLLNMLGGLDGKTEDKKFLKEIVRFLELDGKLANYPSHLSGGQQQRVAIARALVSKPAIVLADEPTGNLDSRTSDKVIDLLKMTSEKFHQTIVMITHNPEIAEKADVRICIEDGKIHK